MWRMPNTGSTKTAGAKGRAGRKAATRRLRVVPYGLNVPDVSFCIGDGAGRSQEDPVAPYRPGTPIHPRVVKSLSVSMSRIASHSNPPSTTSFVSLVL